MYFTFVECLSTARARVGGGYNHGQGWDYKAEYSQGQGWDQSV